MKEKEKDGCMLMLVIVAIIIGVSALLIGPEYQNEHWETITVIDKTVGISSEQSSYLVYTETEVYKIQDLFFCGFFRTSDVYRQLQVGGTYRVKVRGRRYPIMSQYKNIIEAYKMD